jgi:hypothetical protein
MRKSTAATPPDDDVEFAHSVIDLYKWELSDKKQAYAGKLSRDVRRVAYGLVLIRQLLDEKMRSLSGAPDIAASGIREAYGILDHLTTGLDHPIATHIAGIRSKDFRPHKVSIAEIGSLAQAVVVGAMRAVARSEKTTEAAARRAIVNKFAGSEYAFTEAQIKGWHYKFDGTKDGLPDAICNEILRAAEAGNQTALNIGAHFISGYWAVPFPRLEKV